MDIGNVNSSTTNTVFEHPLLRQTPLHYHFCQRHHKSWTAHVWSIPFRSQGDLVENFYLKFSSNQIQCSCNWFTSRGPLTFPIFILLRCSSSSPLSFYCQLFEGLQQRQNDPISLEVFRLSVCMKCHIISLGLREVVNKALNDLAFNGMLSPVNTSIWTTPIFTPLKRIRRPLRYLGSFILLWQKFPNQPTCINPKPHSIPNKVNNMHFSRVSTWWAMICTQYAFWKFSVYFFISYPWCVTRYF